ncbi:MAG TPA: hypothetical protein VLZ06_01700 [Solirubrobacteraceae bacterium]|nr:hypothetical protein [Solirubrobacteraceae bacterium]
MGVASSPAGSGELPEPFTSITPLGGGTPPSGPPSSPAGLGGSGAADWSFGLLAPATAAPVAGGPATSVISAGAIAGPHGAAVAHGRPAPVPSPSPGGAVPASAAAAGFGISIFLVLVWLLLTGAAALGRRLRLASKPLLPAPVVLVPERPG